MATRFLHLNPCHLRIAPHHPGGIAVGIASRFHPQTWPRGRAADQLDDHFVAGPRAATPMARKLAEHSALTCIPLAGPRREMATRQPPAQFVRHPLQRALPQATPARLAPAALGGTPQFARRLGALRSPMPPPAAPRFDGQFGGLGIPSDPDPTRGVVRSSPPSGMALPSSGATPSSPRAHSATPCGRPSRPPWLNSPPRSCFWGSTETTAGARPGNAWTWAWRAANGASRSGGEAPALGWRLACHLESSPWSKSATCWRPR